MMLGIERSRLKEKRRTRKVRFEGFSPDEHGSRLVGKEIFNCSCRDGVIRNGIGMIPCKKEDGQDALIGVSGAEELHLVKINGGGDVEDVQMVFVLYNGSLYVYNAQRQVALKKGSVGENATYNSIKDESKKIYHLLSGSQGIVYTLDANTFTFVYRQSVLDSRAAGGRYFAALPSAKIAYSPPYRPDLIMTDSAECGELYLPMEGGEIRNLRAWGDYLYIFTESKIFRLKVAAREREFELEEVDYAGGRICLNSMVMTGEGLLFLALDGFYLVKGNKAQIFSLKLRVAPYESAVACRVGYCGTYPIIEYKELSESGVSIRRVVIDVERREYFLSESYGTLCGSEFCLSGGVLFRLALDAETGARYRRVPFFETKELNLGTEKRKRLKSMRVEGSGVVNMRILYGSKIKLYPLTFVDGVAQVKLDEVVKEFAVRFTLTPCATVRGMEIEYLTLD